MSKYGVEPGLRSARLTRRQLIVFALVSAVINGVVTASVGTWLAQTYATQLRRAANRSKRSPTSIYERRTRAGMVVSSIRRNARWRRSSSASAPTTKRTSTGTRTSCSNLFVIREVSGELRFALLEQMFEDELVASMADVDRCLTKAYDRKLAGEDVLPVLDACRMASCTSSCSTAAPPSPTSSTS